MKKIILLCIVGVLQGVNAFGQTNAVAPARHPVATHEWRGQMSASNNIVRAPGVSQRSSLQHRSEIKPADEAMFRRIKEEGLLAPRMATTGRNNWAGTESIFRSDNNQMGETCVRDTVVTIFPTGR
jgi:hypothetical protein